MASDKAGYLQYDAALYLYKVIPTCVCMHVNACVCVFCARGMVNCNSLHTQLTVASNRFHNSVERERSASTDATAAALRQFAITTTAQLQIIITYSVTVQCFISRVIA